MQNLVTVTCLRDREQMLLQAESLRYLQSPITHHVIVQESSLDSSWSSLLGPYYSTHQLVLTLAEPCPTNRFLDHPWSNQQYHKLAVYQRIQDSYLILDSKNFFIRTCSLDDWANSTGCGSQEYYHRAANDFSSTITEYSQYFDIPVQPWHLCHQTPFHISHQVMQNFDIAKLLRDFMNFNCMPSEFIFYSCMMKSLGIKFTQKQLHYTVWPNMPIIPDIRWSNSSCLVAGIHPTIIEQYKHSINSWLISQQFDFQFE